MNDITQKEIIAEFGVTAPALKKIRDKHLVASDWYKTKTFPPVIHYTQEGEKRLRVQLEEPGIMPVFEEMICIKQHNNPRWVACSNSKKEKVDVAIPRKLFNVLPGKKIRVEAIKDVNGVSYRHELLSR